MMMVTCGDGRFQHGGGGGSDQYKWSCEFEGFAGEKRKLDQDLIMMVMVVEQNLMRRVVVVMIDNRGEFLG